MRVIASRTRGINIDPWLSPLPLRTVCLSAPRWRTEREVENQQGSVTSRASLRPHGPRGTGRTDYCAQGVQSRRRGHSHDYRQHSQPLGAQLAAQPPLAWATVCTGARPTGSRWQSSSAALASAAPVLLQLALTATTTDAGDRRQRADVRRHSRTAATHACGLLCTQ